jgi:cell division protein FtsW (lipid II flippase)
MADLVYSASSRARARARRRELAQAAPLIARLDWWMLVAVAAIVGYGLWAISGITRHDVVGDPSYYVNRQFVFVGIGLLALIVAIFVDPDI